MASYVEQAILSVKDRSTKPLRKIDREAAKVVRTGKDLGRLKIDIKNLDRTTSQVGSLNRALLRVPKVKRLNVTASVKGVAPIKQELNKLQRRKDVSISVRMPGLKTALADAKALNAQLSVLRRSKSISSHALGPRRSNSGGGAGNNGGDGFLGKFKGEFAPDRAGSTVGRGTVYDLQSEAYFAVRRMVVEAGSVALAAQAVTTSQNLKLGQEDISAVNQMARIFVQGVEGVSLTEARGIGTDLALSIDPSDPNFKSVFKDFIGGRERLELINPDKADANTVALDKLINLAQTSADPERAGGLIRAFTEGIAATGESFNAASFIAALRTSGQASTITDDGLFRMILAFDEQGRQLGSGLNRLVKVLTSENGVSDEQRAKLTAAGLIDAQTGKVKNEELLRTNAFAYLETVLPPLLKARGVDPTDAVAVQGAINDLGFVSQEYRTVGSELVAAEERARAALITAEARLLSAQEASENDLGASIENLKASFDTLASEGLKPFYEALAGPTDAVANFIERVALSGTNVEKMGLAAGGVVTTFGALAGTKGVLNVLTGPSTKLLSSAALLDRAAASMLAASGGDLSGLADGGKKARRGGFLSGLLGGFAGSGGAGFTSTFSSAAAKMLGRIALPVALVVPDKLADGTATGRSSSVRQSEQALEEAAKALERSTRRLERPLAQNALHAASPLNPFTPAADPAEVARLRAEVEEDKRDLAIAQANLLSAQQATNAPVMIEASPDVAADLARPITDAAHGGSAAISEATSAGAAEVGQAMVAGATSMQTVMSSAASEMKTAISQALALSIEVAVKSESNSTPRLDTGATLPQ